MHRAPALSSQTPVMLGKDCEPKCYLWHGHAFNGNRFYWIKKNNNNDDNNNNGEKKIKRRKKKLEKLFSFHLFMSLFYATVLLGHPLPHNVQ